MAKKSDSSINELALSAVRDEYANLVPKFAEEASSAVDSFQEAGSVRQVENSSGTKLEIGPRKIEVLSIYMDSRAGSLIETNAEGIAVSSGMTATKKDNKGKKRRQRFFVGAQVESSTMDWVQKSINLRKGTKDPRDFEITSQITQLIPSTIEESQRAGDKLDRKILEENYEWFPLKLESPIIKSQAEDTEPEPNLDLMKNLVVLANEIINDKLGTKIESAKVAFAKFSEFQLYADSLGTQVDTVIPRITFSIHIKTKEGSETFKALRGSGGTIEECLKRYLPEENKNTLEEVITNLCHDIVKEASELDRGQSTSILGSECPVILSPEVAGVFAHECFGHPSEGDIIVDNRRNKSAQLNLKSRIGSQASDNSKFNVLESPKMDIFIDDRKVHKFSWGHITFDSHGTEAKDAHLIENGIIVEALTDRYTHEEIVDGLKEDIVKRMNERGLSGNVRRENYSHPPIIRMRTTYILPDPLGVGTPEEMAAKYVPKNKKGVYITSCMGGWVTPDNGQWMIYGNLGYLIENGQITNKPLRNVYITGNLSKLSSSIKAIGNIESMKTTFTGFCGKDSQFVPVDGFGPLLYLEDISIGSSYGSHYWENLVKDFTTQIKEVNAGKRQKESIYLSDIHKHDEVKHFCLLSSYLPPEIEISLLSGSNARPTHESVYNSETDTYIITERINLHDR